jgi:hypothetical protein
MTRRRFLISYAALAILAGAGGYGLWLKFQPSSGLIVAALRQHLGHLIVSPEDLRRFGADHLQHVGPKDRWAIRLLAPLAPIYSGIRPLLIRASSPRVQRFEEAVISNFLLGTDFFTSGADESRPIHYIGYPDPYLRPCGRNPLASR